MDFDHENWQQDPDSIDDLRAPTQDEMHAAAGRGEPRTWEATGQVGDAEVRRFADPAPNVLHWKTLPHTLGFGIPGLLLLIGSIIAPMLAPGTLFQPGSMMQLLRLLILIAGLCLLAIAAPWYKPRDWTPEQELKLSEDRDYFKDKRGF